MDPPYPRNQRDARRTCEKTSVVEVLASHFASAWSPSNECICCILRPSAMIRWDPGPARGRCCSSAPRRKSSRARSGGQAQNSRVMRLTKHRSVWGVGTACGGVLRRAKAVSRTLWRIELTTRGGCVAAAKDQRQGGDPLDVMVAVFHAVFG